MPEAEFLQAFMMSTDDWLRDAYRRLEYTMQTIGSSQERGFRNDDEMWGALTKDLRANGKGLVAKGMSREKVRPPCWFSLTVIISSVPVCDSVIVSIDRKTVTACEYIKRQ